MTSKLSPRPRGARKPETVLASDWLDSAEKLICAAATQIDTAGDLAGTAEADMLACYASNVLQGSLSLIRELRASLPSRRKSAR